MFDTEEEITYLSKASWEIKNPGDFSKELTVSFYRNEVNHDPYQKFRAVAVPKNNKVESVITGGGIQNVTETNFATLTCGIGTLEWVHSNADNHVDMDAGEVRLSSWDIMNVRVGCRFKSFTVHLGMDNVFDRKYTVANSYEWDVIGGPIS